MTEHKPTLRHHCPGCGWEYDLPANKPHGCDNCGQRLIPESHLAAGHTSPYHDCEPCHAAWSAR